jgi:hypothetical protein
LKELTDKVKVRLKEEGYGDLIQHITETLEKANFDNRFFNQGEIDIEVIFSVLSGLSNPIKGLKDLGPYAIYFYELGRNEISSLSKAFNEEEMNRIKTLVGEVITSACNNFSEQDATEYYGKLYEFDKEMLKLEHQRLFHPTVTTNYDLVFERCAKKNSEIRADTGFRHDRKSEDKQLPLEKIIQEDRYQEIEYLKLHGSINWWVRDSDKRLVECNEMRPGTSPMGETYNNN